MRAVDVCASDWDCTLERSGDGGKHPAVRLGLRLVGSLTQAAAERLTQARRVQGFASVDDLARRAQLDARDLQSLAQADALQSLAGHRRRQLRTATGQERIDNTTLLAAAPIVEPVHEPPDLFEAPEGEAIALDYAATGLTLRRHPLALLRSRLAQRGWRSAEQLAQLKDGSTACACGIVTSGAHADPTLRLGRQPEHPWCHGHVFTSSVSTACWHLHPQLRPRCARWWCHKSRGRPPRQRNPPRARRTVRTTGRCG